VPQSQSGTPKKGKHVPDAFGFVERRDCPVCGCSRTTTAFRIPFDKGAIGRFLRDYYAVDPRLLRAAPYELMRCPDCTLIFQRFAGDDALLDELYGKWINHSYVPELDPQYQAEVSAPLRSRDGHELLVAADALRMKPEEMTVLDFGMGWGMWARIAKQLGCDVYGREIPADRVAYAVSHGVRPIEMDELGKPMFDLINAEQVMEHVRDLAQTAELLGASLKPNGILKVSVPNAGCAVRIAANLKTGRCAATISELMPVHPLEHVNSFNHRSLSALANRLGLTVVKPTLLQRYAFLKRRRSISLAHSKKTLKELVRPVHQYHNRKNLYVWMVKPCSE
jgi:2-polyprenyl-3-methyl-5-hydroxy-6-metoxy-1,4-benzoquinol methylase